METDFQMVFATSSGKFILETLNICNASKSLLSQGTGALSTLVEFSHA